MQSKIVKCGYCQSLNGIPGKSIKPNEKVIYNKFNDKFEI